nr:hypothetical protein [Tanacetum cinerariifolium]
TKIANENIPAPAPIRSDDQILLFAAWNTLTYEEKTRAYSFQLDETRYVLDANLLREALEITPIDQAHHFVLPPSGDAIMDFVNELGYTEVIYVVSRMAVNNLYQLWRAILSIINQCLTDKTSGKGAKNHKGKGSHQLIDEDEATQPEPEPEPEHQGERATDKALTRPSAQPQDDTSANLIHESPPPMDAETSTDADMTHSGGDTEILTFADKHVIIEEPLSSTRTLSSIKNLDDAYTIRDQFLNEKSTEDDSDEFFAKKDKSCKRRCDDHNPPPPPPGSDPIKKSRHEYDALMKECHWLLTDQVDLVNPEGHRLVPDLSKPLPLRGPQARHEYDALVLSQPPTPQSSVWKTSDTREAPSSFSKQQSVKARMVEAYSRGRQTSNSRTRLGITPNELPEPENNWANALASSYQDLEEYKLL